MTAMSKETARWWANATPEQKQQKREEARQWVEQDKKNNPERYQPRPWETQGNSGTPISQRPTRTRPNSFPRSGRGGPMTGPMPPQGMPQGMPPGLGQGMPQQAPGGQGDPRVQALMNLLQLLMSQRGGQGPGGPPMPQPGGGMPGQNPQAGGPPQIQF